MTHFPPLGLTARFATALGLFAALTAPLQASTDDWPRGHYPLPEEGDLVGEVYTIVTEEEDTLIDIGHEHGIGYEEMIRANPDISIWAPFEGTEVVIPGRFILPEGPRDGLVVNVAEMRLYYYPPTEEGETPRVETYPIAVGRMDWKTPLGETRITEKVKDPAWYPPKSIIQEHAAEGRTLPSVVPPGPDNPMGRFKMRLGIPGYLIHGTNRPEGVGMRVTHGCIRMLPEDIETLFPRLPVGTQVKLINETLKLGWSDGVLHVQAYPYLDEEDGTSIQRITEALSQVDTATSGLEYPVDYARLREVVEVPRGMPTPLEVNEPEPVPETLYDRLELIATEPSLNDEATQES
ncbi:L,D-transpeptidase family protein [Halomonas saccharevitans]|uniref:L,D-transpeptidase ErfK/SrfK n=1 Tax=Halomonas saccharevitans TaxID=416872 RepID=A0A1I7AQU9_9GAMM|nr:L,D-transpeptidase family protein [Halomonas saccharevitans]MDT8878466.1 L,D-transpeptidase family protein [Halomonas saccharevitans]SFT77341.1 L,D-transpeptidase ErfK/SrfK [Halomonas saccharevitans]